ncbi:MAG: lysylphosphatidylglycerol synthase transmembrane domain-containing protein, partial [Pseudomonadota bacterium]
MARRRSTVATLIVGILALAAIILLAINFSDISAFADQAARARPAWLVAAILSQLSTYVCVAIVWRLVLFRLESPLPLSTLVPLSVAKLFADQALPSGGVSGAAFLLYALTRRGVSDKTAFRTFVLATVAFFFAFLLASIISLFALSTADAAPPALAASISVFAAIFLFLAVAASLFFIYKPSVTPAWIAKRRWTAKASEFIGAAARDIGQKPALFSQATLLQFTVRMLDGLTLYLAFQAIGVDASLLGCFFAVVIASAAATIGPIPMGLGTFEAGMIAALRVFGAGLEDALTATLIYRGLSLWLPLLPGFFIIQREFLRS